MSRERYEQMAKLPGPTPEGIRLGNKVLRMSFIITAAIVITFGGLLALLG